MNRPADAETLNDSQRAALDLSRDLIVSAGAGAGKTRVLGLRVIALIEEGRARIDEIIAFTFTEKAASEMRQRVQKMLLTRVQELDPKRDKDRLERLRAAQLEFNRNRISTVHSFCYRMLSDYAWEAGLEPRSPILDERRQSQARDAALRVVLFRSDLDADTELGEALTRLGTATNMGALRETLVTLLRERFSLAPALKIAAERWQEPQAELKRRQEYLSELAEQALAPVRAELARLDFDALSAIAAKDTLRSKAYEVQAALDDGDTARLYAAFLRKGGTPSATPKGAATNWKRNPELKESTSEILGAASAHVHAMSKLLPAGLDEEFEQRAGRVLRDLHTVFVRAEAAYRDACGGGLDFNDLEQRAIELLETNDEVRAEMIKRARFLLIDEYQDTNPVQARLFALLRDGDTTPGRFFAVGDAKQSIYGFRGSDVSIFNHALQDIPRRNRESGAANAPLTPPWGLTCDDEPERRIGIVRMRHNYRTVAPLLELGNSIFDQVFDVPDKQDYDAEPQPMIAGSDAEPDADALIEFAFLHASPQANEDYDETTERRKDDEAELIAARVNRLHKEEGVPFSDIALLVRRGTNNVHYRRAFARYGLPLLVIGEAGLFGTLEALDCINLLRALSNPADDIAMLGLLRSPFAGLSDRYLTELALRHDRRSDLLTRMRADAETAPPEATAFLERFDALLQRAGRDAPALLLTEALTMTGYALAVGCGYESEQRLANVERMVEVVRAMQSELPSLALLVREIVNRIDAGDDEAKGQPEKDAEGVRLMTVHKSKGLEFPIVILPDLGNGRFGGDNGLMRCKPLKPGDPVGIWLPPVVKEGNEKWMCDIYGRVAQRIDGERAKAEERRGLYVAFTRAERRLILTCTTRDNFSSEAWGHQLAKALGITGWEDTCESDIVESLWLQGIDRRPPVSHAAAIATLQEGTAAGRIELEGEIDAGLVRTPEFKKPVMAHAFNPDATEFGTLVHAALEQRARTGGIDFGLLGVSDATEQERLNVHVGNGAKAMAKLPQARRELPEFGVITPDGARYMDLLRDLGDGRFQIVDYKSDRISGDTGKYAEVQYGDQLRGYGRALRGLLASRGVKVSDVELYVCFTAPEISDDTSRLVNIKGLDAGA